MRREPVCEVPRGMPRRRQRHDRVTAESTRPAGRERLSIVHGDIGEPSGADGTERPRGDPRSPDGRQQVHRTDLVGHFAADVRQFVGRAQHLDVGPPRLQPADGTDVVGVTVGDEDGREVSAKVLDGVEHALEVVRVAGVDERDRSSPVSMVQFTRGVDRKWMPGATSSIVGSPDASRPRIDLTRHGGAVVSTSPRLLA